MVSLKINIIAFTIVLSFFSCDLMTDSDENNTVSCPDSTYYHSQIQVLSDFYYFEHDSISADIYDSINHKYNDLSNKVIVAISYLTKTTRLNSYISIGYFFGYLSEEDYKKDIDQYYKWYQDCMSRASN